MPSKILFHEWIIIVLFCLILLGLAAFAIGMKKELPPEIIHPKPSLTLEIKVEGEVAKAGVYHLPLKTSLKELLDQAELLPTADLSELKWRRKLREGQTIHVPAKRLITIHLKGAVKEPGPLRIMSGARCCELADQLEVLPEADLKSLRIKKRYILEGETIDIPVKKEKGKPRVTKTKVTKKKS